mmetsp:Transcript_22274/g.60124  ORF Transcript_22274/g.60124 Transcript_22274/m.60124 type:complete len:87 (+) Transcript_22274:3-263(+)
MTEEEDEEGWGKVDVVVHRCPLEQQHGLRMGIQEVTLPPMPPYAPRELVVCLFRCGQRVTHALTLIVEIKNGALMRRSVEPLSMLR